MGLWTIKVHADILKMAKTKEKTERIKWFHARNVFFHHDNKGMSEGLELARQFDHSDARLLASLFPDGAPETRAQAMKGFGDPDEPLFVLGKLGLG